jgi:hypothetical protein
LRGTLASLDPQSAADLTDIENDLRSAIAALDDIGAIPDRARTQAALGVWLTRQARSADAASHLSAARDTFTDLRATAWLHVLDATLSLAAAG